MKIKSKLNGGENRDFCRLIMLRMADIDPYPLLERGSNKPKVAGSTSASAKSFFSIIIVNFEKNLF